MRAINLYLMTQIQGENWRKYEGVLSNRNEKQKIKTHEYENLVALAGLILQQGGNIKDLDGFYFSYSIEQIGKEFDLLKIDREKIVVNIELKSGDVSEEKIRKQLVRNKYYLEHLGIEICLFTYVQKENAVYTLEKNDVLRKSNIEELICCLKMVENYEIGQIDDLFRPKDFLISPLNTPEKFIAGSYFLTQQQEQIQKEILHEIVAKQTYIKWGITGKAGTGKTLLLYDIARECSKYGKCCIIHSGILCEGHNQLNELLHNVDIRPAKCVQEIDFAEYKFIFVDETQRIYSSALEKIVGAIEMNKAHAIFSYDTFQTLSYREEEREIVSKLYQAIGFQERVLSDKIRTNKEIASFIRLLIDLNDKPQIKYHYQDVDILYAEDISSAQKIIEFYRQEKSYVFINYTQSRFKCNTIDAYQGDINTHHVIGQEFDNVLIMLDHNFRYNKEGRLQGKIHPNPDYIFYKLFYQGVSRAREKLCILVVGNEELFSTILSIKSDA